MGQDLSGYEWVINAEDGLHPGLPLRVVSIDEDRGIVYLEEYVDYDEDLEETEDRGED